MDSIHGFFFFYFANNAGTATGSVRRADIRNEINENTKQFTTSSCSCRAFRQLQKQGDRETQFRNSGPTRRCSCRNDSQPNNGIPRRQLLDSSSNWRVSRQDFCRQTQKPACRGRMGLWLKVTAAAKLAGNSLCVYCAQRSMIMNIGCSVLCNKLV